MNKSALSYIYIYGYIWVYMDIYGYIRIYIYIYIFSKSRRVCHLLPLPAVDCSNSHEFPAPTGHFLTNCLDLVLWKCSYGPWDHFMFSAEKWIRLVCYQSDLIFLRKTWFSSWLARCKVPSWAMWQKAFIIWRKAFIFWRKAFIFLEKGFYFLEIAVVEISIV